MNTKEKIIAALESSKGDFISGEELAEEIGVSRNAVWKAIKTLKEQGYNIEAVTNKGYKLSSDSDIISREGIALGLDNIDLIECIEIYEEISSTNDLAKKYLYLDVPQRLDDPDNKCHIIIAKKQTGGRGHNRSSFASPKGGIYMSIVLPEDMMKSDKSVGFSEHIRECVVKSIYKLSGLKLEEKGSQGLYLNGVKICGILTETLSDYDEGTISDYIIGIGIRYDELWGKKSKSYLTRNKLIADIINRVIL